MFKFKSGTKVKIRKGSRGRVLPKDIGSIAKIIRPWRHGGSFTYDVRMSDERLIGYYHDELELAESIKLKRCMQWK